MVGVVRSLASAPFVPGGHFPRKRGKPLFFPLWMGVPPAEAPACAGMTLFRSE